MKKRTLRPRVPPWPQVKPESLAHAAAIVRARRWCLAPVVCLTLAGCGSKLPTVSGQVTFRTTSLGTGSVVFHPQGGSVPGYGTIGPDGTYTVKTGNHVGITAGDYAVTVRARAPAPEPTPSNPMPIGVSLIPERFGKPDTSGLMITVVPGANRYDIHLDD